MLRQDKKRRKLTIVVIILIALLLLVISEYKNKITSAATLIKEEEALETKISDLIETLDGISSADVMVTMDSYGNGKGSPIVRGVSIVCHGKRREDTKSKIIMLVSTALGISSDKIFVSFT